MWVPVALRSTMCMLVILTGLLAPLPPQQEELQVARAQPQRGKTQKGTRANFANTKPSQQRAAVTEIGRLQQNVHLKCIDKAAMSRVVLDVLQELKQYRMSAAGIPN